MNLGGSATASITFNGQIGTATDTEVITNIKDNDDSDSVTLTYEPTSLDLATVNVEATSIEITFLANINYNPGEKIVISGLTDQDNHTTGTKFISFDHNDTSLDSNAITVTDTAVTIDLNGVPVDNGGVITIKLGYEMTSGNDGWTENSDIQTSIDEVDSAISTLRSQGKNLGNNLGTITTRQNFTSELINTLRDGADNLTLADINQEGANMLMLQTRQSLSTTSLSLSSQANSSVLRLF